MFHRFIAVLIVVFSNVHGISQEQCGFDILHKKALATDPAYRRIISEQKEKIEKEIARKKNARVMMPQVTLYTIPVVVHIIHTGGAIGSAYNPTDVQIQNTIADLNAVYNGTKAGTEGVGDTQIQFALATINQNCTPTSGITRTNGSGITNYVSNGVNVASAGGTDQLNVKNLVRWDPTRYYNIWVVNEIDDHDGTTGGSFIGGFAYLPGASTTLDGTVMLASQMAPNRKTLPHEIGHAFGLYHPFEGATTAVCPVNTDCVNDGDEVCDTDPILQPTTGVCRVGINACAGAAVPYNFNTEHNYMNYTGCVTLFTAGQRDRLLAFAGSYYRVSLSESWGGAASYPVNPYSSPAAASCTPTTSATGLANNFAGLMAVELANRTHASGTAMMDGGFRNGTTSCLNLIELTRGNIYNFNLLPLSTNYEQLRGWIDYNNDGIFNNLTEQFVYQNDIGPPDPLNLVVNGTLTVPLTATTNTVIRMRITEELSTRYNTGYNIVNACYNPVYGQAEDYPVIIMPEILLPASFHYFNVTHDGENVSVNWKNSSETNTSKYTIERASLGKAFTAIGERKVSGTNMSYIFSDKSPGNGTWHYRIRQENKDGVSAYSAVKTISFSSERAQRLKILANPFHNIIKISFTEVLKKPASIRVSDASGRLVHNEIVEHIGQNILYVDLGNKNLVNGIYFLEVRVGDQKFIEKIVRQ